MHHPDDDGDSGEPPGVVPRVVLVHGSMDRSTSFAKALRHLADLEVVRYDRRGYGRSTGAGVVGFDGHVDDLLAVVGERPAVVVGHSLGGVLALTAAQRRPDVVVAVGAYEAPMAWMPWWSQHSAGSDAVSQGSSGDAAERFMRRMIGDERWLRLPPSTRAARRAEGRALLAELVDIRQPVAPYQPESLTMPVVAGHGTSSREHHVVAARHLAEHAPGAELVVIDGAGHGAHASHPEAFAALVRRTVDRTRTG